MTARILKYDGLGQDETPEWIEDRLNGLKNTTFSDRLTDNARELHRVTDFAINAV